MPLMSSKWVTHTFAGGWATDFGPTFYGGFGDDNKLNIPFLTEARNIVFEFDGGIHKVPGTNTLNSVAIVDHYVNLPGTVNSYVSTPDSSANSITGDIDIRVKVSMDDWTPFSDNHAYVSKFQNSSGDSYVFMMNSSDRLTFSWRDSSDVQFTESATAATGFTDGTIHWIRATLDVNDGSSNHVLKFYTSNDAITWTQLGATVTTAGVTTIQDSTLSVLCGIMNTVSWPVVGKMYRAQIWNGYDGAGSLVLDMYAGDAQANAGSWISINTGEQWTVGSAASIVGQANVMGVYDYWRQGAIGAASQRRVVHAGTTIQNDDGAGTFSSLFTGLESGVVPSYATFDDLLIISSSSTTDTPRSWDQTTAQVLAGTPPRFSFSVSHKNYLWAAGNWEFPSRLYYSATSDPEDWTAASSGSIDIDPNDGDMITGIVSWKDRLMVFKGPNKMSIHMISGSSESDWARTTFTTGISAAWQGAIFKFGDDVGFVSPYATVHSLKASADYGDFNQTFLSHPISNYLRDNINHGRHRFIQAMADPNRGQVWIAVTPSGQVSNTRTLIMDYRFQVMRNEPFPRWSYWDARPFASLGLVRDNNTSRPRIMAGGYDGYVYRLDQASRTNNGTAINMTASTPALTYGEEWLLKNLGDVGVSIQAQNNNNITLNWVRDGNATQTSTVTQGSTGGVFDTALFNTAVFGGAAYVPRFYGLENGGDFRGIQFQFVDTANSSDLEIHSFMAKITPSGESQEN
jgi:hypothetical protein